MPRLFSSPVATLVIAAATLAAFVASNQSDAAVVVVTNRMAEPLTLQARIDDGPAQTVKLPPGDARPFFASSGVHVLAKNAAPGTQEQLLTPGAAYFFGSKPGDEQPTLHQIGLGESIAEAWKPIATPLVELPESNVIKVKLLVDDDEVRQRRVWEPILRERIDKVSAALEAHCGMVLRVVAIEEWNSDDAQRDFFKSLGEFEREVLPAPADVAIGFSSQFDIAQGRVHLGGTRQPLHSHILVKERSRNVLEPERIELLAHELGHYLGATHSPEPKSVMRPVIGQGVQRVAGARLQYDAPNTLLMSLLAEEMRQRGVDDIAKLSPNTRRRMREIYTAVNPTLPDDPAAGLYVQLMGAAGVGPLIGDTTKILSQVTRVAKLKKDLVEQAKATATTAEGQAEPTGDQLLELYVRQAALAAKQVQRENAPRAFLLALGIAFDDADILRRLPISSAAVPAMEPASQQTERKAALDAMAKPAMHNRTDLAQNFFVSAHLVALLGSQSARGGDVAKSILASGDGSTLSFADMAASRAGIAFAHAVLSERLSMDDIARSFTVASFLPPEEELREGLPSPEVVPAEVAAGGSGLDAELARIEARMTTLPVYQQLPPPSGN